MQFFLSVLGFIFLLLTLGMAAIVWKVRRGMRNIRDAMEEQMNDDAFRRMADKNYYRNERDKGPEFDEEYFRGDPNSWRTKAEHRQNEESKRQWRKTQTAEGVTIYDDRDPNKANKKIFAKDEGEYVDFREE